MLVHAHAEGRAASVHALRSGAADAAVLIRPTGIDEIRRTAAERLLMPPKSTFFTKFNMTWIQNFWIQKVLNYFMISIFHPPLKGPRSCLRLISHKSRV